MKKLLIVVLLVVLAPESVCYANTGIVGPVAVSLPEARRSAATQAQRDAYCVDVLGESAGCDPFAW